MSDLQIFGQPAILFGEDCARGAQCEENQCSVLHASIPLGELLIVASGIGANAGGAAAARLAVEHFHANLAELPRDYPAASAIREAAALANAKILAASAASGAPGAEMCSTVVVALLQQDAVGTSACVGHVGLSRAYLVRASRLHRLTTDHSAVQTLLNQGLISPQEAVDHPSALLATRCLGRFPHVEIDIEQHPLAVDDTLLLCSEGLWQSVPEQKIQRAAAATGLTLETAAHNLLGLALDVGSPDSIGIEIARLIPPPEPAPPQIEPKRTIPKWILAVFLLALVGLGMLAFVLAYLALWRN